MNHEKEYARLKALLHTCSPAEYSALKSLMNYHYKKWKGLK